MTRNSDGLEHASLTDYPDELRAEAAAQRRNAPRVPWGGA